MRWMLALLLSSQALASEYRVGVGDELDVQVYDEERMSGTVVVNDQCAIKVDFVGYVEVCGRTTTDVEGLLTAAFTPDYLVDPQISVKVAKFRSQRVDVLGEVAKPGPQYLEGPTTLIEVISMAGGPKADNVTAVEIISADGAVRRLNTTSINPGDDVSLSTGDTVYLKPGEVVYIDGEVNKPGVVVLQDGLTVTQALARAGGVGEYANIRRVLVLRGDGEKLRVNLRRVERGTADDVSLNSDDQVRVPRGAF